MTLTDSACPSAFVCFGTAAAAAAENDSDSTGSSEAVASTTTQPASDCTEMHSTSMMIENNNSLWASGKATDTLDKSSPSPTAFSFPRRRAVDLEFANVRYTVGRLSVSQRKYVRQEILHGISGTFRSGQLTAIMGPSGAGKSTLLNILAGYVETGVSGTVLVNGKSRSANSQTFRNLSAYIHQQDELREQLTVAECMTTAAHLKLGAGVSTTYKRHVIQRVLELLGLRRHQETRAGQLSGGQRKRLTIALELINNPPVIFLDEPTTGLDSSSTASCIALLKRLAADGRTIVCTIHQPSALLFEMFDRLFAVAAGRCIYQGRTQLLVPFLADLGLPCPNYHNPADFLLEVAVGDYDVDLTRLVSSAEKKYCEERAGQQQPLALPTCGVPLTPQQQSIAHLQARELQTTASHEATEDLDHMAPASLWLQFCLLFVRNFRCTVRNKFLIAARIVAHVFIAIVFGLIYLNVGPNATAVLGNYVYLYGSVLLIVYTGKMSVLLSFPLEMEIMTREHFNRWYQLGPYYLSVILFEIPYQMFVASLYVFISYYLTGNYYELFRFNYFLLMCMMVTICAQSWGFFIGVVMPIKIAVFAGPILAVLFSVFGFCTRLVDITPLFSWMWHISYFRAGFHGAINTVYGMSRADLECPETAPLQYCHFKNPRIFLTEMLIEEQQTLGENVALMGGVTVAMHVLTVMVLWLRLNKR